MPDQRDQELCPQHSGLIEKTDGLAAAIARIDQNVDLIFQKLDKRSSLSRLDAYVIAFLATGWGITATAWLAAVLLKKG